MRETEALAHAERRPKVASGALRLRHASRGGWVVALACLASAACAPALQRQPRAARSALPSTFPTSIDGGVPDTTTSSATLKWNEFFADPKLAALVDEALANNQELNVVSLEVDIAQNEILTRQGEFLPKAGIRGGLGIDKVGKYTSQGASDEATGVPEHLPNFGLGLFASWEIDVWSKLRNATKAAQVRYLASLEGRKFTTTVLVGEIAETYYELLALDAQLGVLKQNVGLQKDALEIVRLQKEAARVTELAVKRFEAEVLKNESRIWDVQQQIVKTENHLNFLVGRFPQRVERDTSNFTERIPASVHTGIPSQMLENRPDVMRAELEVAAFELDVSVAKAAFYPQLEISAGLGIQSFDLAKLITTPASLFYNAAADVMAPLFNRKALTANYYTANAQQMQAVWRYEQAILKGYGEAATQLATIENLGKSYELRSLAVDRLNDSIQISGGLFTSARADYVEVLLVRREALESQMELIETKKQQLTAVVALYQALGGGWR